MQGRMLQHCILGYLYRLLVHDVLEHYYLTAPHSDVALEELV